MRYQFFNFVIDSAIELPELPMATGEEPLFTVRADNSKSASTATWETRLTWRWQGGQVGGSVARLGRQIRYRFDGYCTFLVSEDGWITCRREPECPDYLMRHFLLNQVLPRAAAATGRLILHASAVALEGRSGVVAFVGDSGFGKSTLAAALSANGATLMGDDALLVDSSDRGVFAAGSFTGVRLLPDALASSDGAVMGGHATRACPVAPYSEKRQLSWVAPGGAAFRRLLPLEAVFILNDPGQPAPDIRITPLRGGQALLPLVRAAFSLDPTLADNEAGLFAEVAKVFRQGVAAYRLEYPREFTALSQIRDRIAKQLATTP